MRAQSDSSLNLIKVSPCPKGVLREARLQSLDLTITMEREGPPGSVINQRVMACSL